MDSREKHLGEMRALNVSQIMYASKEVFGLVDTGENRIRNGTAHASEKTRQNASPCSSSASVRNTRGLEESGQADPHKNTSMFGRFLNWLAWGSEPWTVFKGALTYASIDVISQTIQCAHARRAVTNFDKRLNEALLGTSNTIRCCGRYRFVFYDGGVDV